MKKVNEQARAARHNNVQRRKCPDGCVEPAVAAEELGITIGQLQHMLDKRKLPYGTPSGSPRRFPTRAGLERYKRERALDELAKESQELGFYE